MKLDIFSILDQKNQAIAIRIKILIFFYYLGIKIPLNFLQYYLDLYKEEDPFELLVRCCWPFIFKNIKLFNILLGPSGY